MKWGLNVNRTAVVVELSEDQISWDEEDEGHDGQCCIGKNDKLEGSTSGLLHVLLTMCQYVRML